MYLKYVGIRVRDLERSVKFYSELFGLKEERRGDMTRYGLGIWVLLRDEQSGERIELDWYPPGSQYDTPYTSGEELDHIGFVVDDVGTTYRELLAKGVEPAGVDPSVTEGWTPFVKDPDGNWVEIFQMTPPAKKTGA